MNKPSLSLSDLPRASHALEEHPAHAANDGRDAGAPSAAPRRWRRIRCGTLVAIFAFLFLLSSSPLVRAQSLWRDEGAKSLVADKRANAVGDIITILIQESNSASKNNSTSTAKKSAVDSSINTFFYPMGSNQFISRNGTLPALKFNSNQNFDGGGKINNSENITARIAARVVEVLPNGNLVIEGTKKTAFASETQDAVLRGVVRQEDIAANNTVYSYNISDVTIKYIGKGVVSDSQRKGWFFRIWEKINPL